LPGQSLSLLTRNVGSDILSGPATINGATYAKIFYVGRMDFNTTLPALDGMVGDFTLTVPFTIAGQLKGCLNNANFDGPCTAGYLFDTLLSGQGLAATACAASPTASARTPPCLSRPRLPSSAPASPASPPRAGGGAEKADSSQ
jgi:hypothetical protein